MSRADRIEAEFPPGTIMPPEMRALCDFVDHNDDPVCGYTRLRPEGENLKGWFSADGLESKQLAGFGAGPDGSTLALWLYAGQDTSSAPVVHLGSEGTCFVLADNFREFLQLLAIGYNELGFDNLTEPPAEPETTERLRCWLATEYGIHPPSVGAEILRQAESNHPDFGAWVHAAQARRDAMV